jgi:zinc transport system ATP-binding protein
MKEDIDDTVSLEVMHRGERVFSDSGKWLLPLFELESFLKSTELPRNEILVRDKVIGRAAALLLVRLRIRKVEAGVLSRLGEEIFLFHGIEYSAGKMVDRILCRTEEILKTEKDPEKAYRVISERAGR